MLPGCPVGRICPAARLLLAPGYRFALGVLLLRFALVHRLLGVPWGAHLGFALGYYFRVCFGVLLQSLLRDNFLGFVLGVLVVSGE